MADSKPILECVINAAMFLNWENYALGREVMCMYPNKSVHTRITALLLDFVLLFSSLFHPPILYCYYYSY